MKKLVTLTASALLMGTMATAASAAETAPTTPIPAATTTDTTTTAPTTTPAPATTNTTTNTDATAQFVGNQNGFSFPIPAYWDSSVTNTQYNAEQLTSMGQNGSYLVDFTYTPEFDAPDGTKKPVKFASIRGYERATWDAMTNKDAMGTPLNTTGNMVYVLESVTANPFSNATDMQRFSNLLQNVRTGISANFNTSVTPAPGTVTNPTPGTPVVPGNGNTLVIANDPSKISVNPTPTIELTGMTPFYKSPGGTMIGYLGPQKLDTTGQGQTDPASGQWVEIYTWLGMAWIVVE